MLVGTDLLMPDVLRSNTTESGELCVITALKTETHKSHALCLDLGKFVRCYRPVNYSQIPNIFTRVIRPPEYAPCIIPKFHEFWPTNG